MRGQILILFPFLFSSCVTCGSDEVGTQDDDTDDDDFDDDDTDNVPGAPKDLVATASGTMSIWLEWQDADELEDGFKIERSLDGTNFEEIADVPFHHEEDPTVYYEDEGLRPDTTYYYRVKAYNEFGESDYSNIASAKTLEWEGFSEPVYYDVNEAPIFIGLGNFDDNEALDLAVANEGRVMSQYC